MQRAGESVKTRGLDVPLLHEAYDLEKRRFTMELYSGDELWWKGEQLQLQYSGQSNNGSAHPGVHSTYCVWYTDKGPRVPHTTGTVDSPSLVGWLMQWDCINGKPERKNNISVHPSETISSFYVDGIKYSAHPANLRVVLTAY